jgi:uncharacterized protein YacL
MKSLWAIRILFLSLCTLGGYALSQVRPEYVGQQHGAALGMAIGFGFGGLLIALDEMLKGFSLRAFSAITFGLLLGWLVALLVEHSGLFVNADEKSVWLIRLCLFLSFGYIGIVLAMRSNKEDFSLIIPYVRFAQRNQPENFLLLDTSVIIDGRVADLLETKLIEGLAVIPRFVLRELQQLADSADPLKRIRGRRGLEMLNRLQQNSKIEVRIHDADFPEEHEVDSKLVRLARMLNAKLFTNDYNLTQVASLQKVICVNLNEVGRIMKSSLLPGDLVTLKIVREGRDKGQGIAYLPDGVMVVVNNAQSFIGKDVEVQIQSNVQTGAGVLIFGEIHPPPAK